MLFTVYYYQFFVWGKEEILGYETERYGSYLGQALH